MIGAIRAGIIAMAAAAVSLLAAPASAIATTSCDYSPTGKLLEILLPAAGDSATVVVVTGDIRVTGNALSLTCTGGTPTVTNTNVITFVASAAGGNLVQITNPRSFAPGESVEAAEMMGTPEIESFINFNNGPGSELRLVPATTADESIRLGNGGINPNATAGEVAPDADILPTDVPFFSIDSFSGADDFNAQGGAGTGGPLTQPVRLSGGSGADLLTGGEAGDVLRGEGGNDTVSGMGGEDVVWPGLDADVVDGGAGVDELSFSQFNANTEATGGVTVDLAMTGPQDTGGSFFDSYAGIENLTGTSFGDVLRGDGGPNRLGGDSGSDTLEGRGGVDSLFAGGGDDGLDVRDGGVDQADCGADDDTVAADAPGTDTLVDCENPLFPATVAPPPGDGGSNGGSGGAPPDLGLTFDATGSRAQRVLKQKGVIAEAACPFEDCVALFTAQGRVKRPSRDERVALASRLSLRSVSVPIAAGETKRVKLRLKRKQLKRVKAALKAGNRLRFTVTVEANDAAGNVASRSFKVKAKR